MTLLQKVSISTATVVCPRTVFTQLVTDSPDLAVIIVWTTEHALGFEFETLMTQQYATN